MANDFKNTQLVVDWAVKAFKNALKMTAKIDHQLDDSKVFSGKKVSATAEIRRPVMFETKDGATFIPQDIEEGTVTVTVDQRKHIGFTLTDEDMALKIEDINERYIKPTMIDLAQFVESRVASKYTEIPNFVGTPGTTPSTFLDVANAEAELHKLGVPEEAELVAFYDSKASVSLANGLKGVFPQEIAKKAIERAKIGVYGGFTIFRSNSLKSHTVGAATGTILVDDAGVTSVTYAASKDTDTQTLNLDGVADTSTALAFKAGDIITLAGVNSVNRRTREDTGDLATFTVTEDSIASTGVTDNILLTIAPPVIISGPYQTVTAAPADDAVVIIKTGDPATSHRQNLGWHPNALTMAMVPLDVAGNGEGVSQARREFEGISITATRWFDGKEMEMNFRFDILFEIFVQNRSFAVRTTG